MTRFVRKLISWLQRSHRLDERGEEYLKSIVSKDGLWTTAMLSARFGRLDVLKYILSAIEGEEEGLQDCAACVMCEPVKPCLPHETCGSGHAPPSSLSLLHAASLGGCIDVLSFVVDAGGNVEERDAMGNTPLILACEARQYDCAKWLASTGKADLNASNKDGATALHYCVHHGNLELVRWLERKGASIHMIDENGETPFAVACAAGHLTLAKWLKRKGADCFRLDTDGRTPFMSACANGKLDVARWLLTSCKPDLQQRDAAGMAALALAEACGHEDITSWLRPILEVASHQSNERNAKPDESPLIAACAAGDIEATHWLLANCGSNVNERLQDTGKTPFLVAVEKRHFDVVEFLASKGANVHAKTLNGDGAFELLISKSHSRVSPEEWDALLEIGCCPKKAYLTRHGDRSWIRGWKNDLLNNERVAWFRRKHWLMSLTSYTNPNAHSLAGRSFTTATETVTVTDKVAVTALAAVTEAGDIEQSEVVGTEPLTKTDCTSVAALPRNNATGESINDLNVIKLLTDPRLLTASCSQVDDSLTEFPELSTVTKVNLNLNPLAVNVARFLSTCCEDAACAGICIRSGPNEVKTDRRRSLVLPTKRSILFPDIPGTRSVGSNDVPLAASTDIEVIPTHSGNHAATATVHVLGSAGRDDIGKAVVLLPNDTSAPQHHRRSRRHSSVTQGRADVLLNACTPQPSPVKLKPLALGPLELRDGRSPAPLPKPVISTMIELRTPILLPIPGVQPPAQPRFEFSKSLTTSVDKDSDDELGSDLCKKLQLKPIVRSFSGRNVNAHSGKVTTHSPSAPQYYIQPMRISASLSRSVSLDPVEEEIGDLDIHSPHHLDDGRHASRKAERDGTASESLIIRDSET